MNTMSLSNTQTYILSSSKNRGIVAYLIIAFGVTWATWIPIWLLGIPPNSDIFNMGVMVAAFAPALAAIIVRRWVTREGFADAGLAPNLRRAWPFYIFAWLWPVLACVTLGIAGLFGVAVLNEVASGLAPALVLALVMTPVLFGEEFGWRSYLQIRLFSNRPLLAALATGTIWGVWHYPMVLGGYLGNQHGLLGFVVFPTYTILFSILLGWFRLRTGSVWAPSLAHAANNMVLEAIAPALFVTLPGNGDLMLDPRGLVVLIPLGLVCAWIILSGQLQPKESENAAQTA